MNDLASMGQKLLGSYMLDSETIMITIIGFVPFTTRLMREADLEETFRSAIAETYRSEIKGEY